MKKKTIGLYGDIDWDILWQNGRQQKSWKSKEAEDWDKKAAAFAERNDRTPYTPLLLSRLPLRPTATVLDIGCGPGTLALPLAQQVRQVTAVDYSAGMLKILQQRAEKEKITNIHCVHGSWEDDWQTLGLQPADIAIASRSMNVADLGMAIDKLNAYAKKYAFITDRIAPSPFDPEAFTAIGRPFDSGPDYIFTLNMLYCRGIHANMEILQLDDQAIFNSMEEAVQSYTWMFKELTTKETGLLEELLRSRIMGEKDGRITFHRPYPPRWALIWWETDAAVKQ